MARIRTIKPEFPQSESMGRVSREARLLFIMLWTIVDDAGRTRAASRMLASVLYPYDDDAKKHIGAWLGELEREGCIRLYEVEGASYLQIENWLDHQKIDKPSKSRLPEPSSRNLDNIREDSPTSREPSTTDLVPSTGPSTKDHIDQPRASRFGDFWSACPKKVGKGKAQSLFSRAERETSQTC
jgi:hypothetical protein